MTAALAGSTARACRPPYAHRPADAELALTLPFVRHGHRLLPYLEMHSGFWCW